MDSFCRSIGGQDKAKAKSALTSTTPPQEVLNRGNIASRIAIHAVEHERESERSRQETEGWLRELERLRDRQDVGSGTEDRYGPVGRDGSES